MSNRLGAGRQPVQRYASLLLATLALLATGIVQSLGTTTASAATGVSQQSAVSEASAELAPAMKSPTNLGLQQLSKKPPSGKVIAWLYLNLGPSIVQYQAVKQAGPLVGWTVHGIPTAADPQSVNTAFTAGLAMKPNAIGVPLGLPIAEMSSELAAAKAQGVAVFGNGLDKPTGLAGNGEVGREYSPAWAERLGRLGADYIVKESNANADIALFSLPAGNASATTWISKGFTDRLSSICSRCNLTTVNTTYAALGLTLPNTVVSTLEAHPNIKYVFFDFGGMTGGVNAALAAAGLSNRAQISGALTASTNVVDLLHGKPGFWVTDSVMEESYAYVYGIAKFFEGAKTVTITTPVQVLTPKNIASVPLGTGQEADIPLIPGNFVAQFKHLGIG